MARVLVGLLALGVVVGCGSDPEPKYNQPFTQYTDGCTAAQCEAVGLVCDAASGRCVAPTTTCTAAECAAVGKICDTATGQCVNDNPDPDDCSVGTCTEIQGGSVCLDNGGIPAGAESCEGGASCPTGDMPVNVQDQDGNTTCMCLEECGGIGPVDPPPPDDCTSGTCTEIQGGSVCLDNGGVPADAESCEGGVSCPTGDVPVTVQDQDGNASCMCLEQCGGTDPVDPPGDCPIGTCTEIQGGSVCLDNGGLPADSPACGADNSCPTDMVPVTVQDQDGNSSCMCLYNC